MKFNFDEVVDRTHEAGSYSAKWSETPNMAAMFQAEEVPEDRLCFYIADMDFRTAPAITEALQKVAAHGIFGYSAAPKEYFEAICRWMKDRFDLIVQPEEIYCDHGAHTAIVNIVAKLTNPGDGVIVPTPSYFYRGDINAGNRYFVGCPLKNDNGYYTFDYELFERLCKEPQNKMVILMQPHNPTGRLWKEDEVKKIAEICRANNVIMLCDDVHMDFKRKENKVVPFIKTVGPEGIVMITGLGKTFNLAGLSITNIIIQDKKLAEKFGTGGGAWLSPFSIAACIAAYTQGDEWVDALNDYLDDVVNYAVDRFHKELPKLKVHRPEGTYILWLDFTDCGFTPEELDKRIAGKAHVSITDGTGMEPDPGTIFRRFCAASPKSRVAEAIDRIVACLNE